MSSLFPMLKDDFDLFDDVFSVPMFGREPLMKTDVHEKDGKYVLEMDLPGYNKEDIKLSLYNGELTVEAKRENSREEKDDNGTVLRQERFTGNCSRTFYVGKGVTEADIHAGYENGTLIIEVPSQETKQIEEKKYIDIL